MRAAQMSVAVLLLSTSCEALVLGRVLRPGPVASRAGTAQLGFFDDLFSKPKPEELIGDVENVAGFSDEEFLALKLCSLSEDAPCRVAKYQVIEKFVVIPFVGVLRGGAKALSKAFGGS